MPVYKAPVDEVLFLLNDVFQISRYNNLPGFADASPDLIEPVLAEAAKLCEQVVQPLNLPGDREGCTRHDDGSVTTPKGFKDAYRQYAEGGWMGISSPPEFGGQGLPETTTVIVNEMMASANMAFYIERAAGNIPVRRTDPYNIVGIRIVLSHSVYPFRYSLAFSTIGLSVSRNGFIRAYSTLVSREQNV